MKASALVYHSTERGMWVFTWNIGISPWFSPSLLNGAGILCVVRSAYKWGFDLWCPSYGTFTVDVRLLSNGNIFLWSSVPWPWDHHTALPLSPSLNCPGHSSSDHCSYFNLVLKRIPLLSHCPLIPLFVLFSLKELFEWFNWLKWFQGSLCSTYFPKPISPKAPGAKTAAQESASSPSQMDRMV